MLKPDGQIPHTPPRLNHHRLSFLDGTSLCCHIERPRAPLKEQQWAASMAAAAPPWALNARDLSTCLCLPPLIACRLLLSQTHSHTVVFEYPPVTHRRYLKGSFLEEGRKTELFLAIASVIMQISDWYSSQGTRTLRLCAAIRRLHLQHGHSATKLVLISCL